MLINISENIRYIASTIGTIDDSKIQELLNSPLGRKFNITKEDIENAEGLLEKTLASSDSKLMVALLIALAVAGGVGSNVYNKIKTINPNDKNIQEFIQEGQTHNPKDAIHDLLDKLKYGEPKKDQIETKIPQRLISDFDRALLDVAHKLEIKNPEWLKKVILFESHGKPDIKNPVSTARGLIQFLNSTSRGMGYGSSVDLVKRHSTAIDQLYGPVYKYLSKYKPFPTEQSLYMAVFRPSDMYKDPNTIFPKKVRRKNKGIIRIKDYINKVRSAPANQELAVKVAFNYLKIIF